MKCRQVKPYHQIVMQGTTQIQVYGHGSNISDVVHSVTQWTSGAAKTIRLSGRYEATQ